MAGSKVRSSPAKAGRAASEAAIEAAPAAAAAEEEALDVNLDAFTTTMERCCGLLATALGLKAEAWEREACISRVGGCFGGGRGLGAAGGDDEGKDPERIRESERELTERYESEWNGKKR